MTARVGFASRGELLGVYDLPLVPLKESYVKLGRGAAYLVQYVCWTPGHAEHDVVCYVILGSPIPMPVG